MADAANATLHTPWDCRWSRFSRRTHADARATTREQTRGGLWECVHTDACVAITEADCAACPFWEYQPTTDSALVQAKTCERAARDRSVRQIQGSIRITLFVLAANVRMGDSNERFGALAKAQPEQIHRAMLGDDPVNMSTCGHHTRTGLQ